MIVCFVRLLYFFNFSLHMNEVEVDGSNEDDHGENTFY